jgi:hypothetical protein
VKKLNVLTVTAAMLFVSVVFANGAQNSNHVQGEKLDSGVDEIGYYCDPEYIGNAVLGEKLDSGLGELTQQEIDRVVAASKPTVAASNNFGTFLALSVPPSNEGE